MFLITCPVTRTDELVADRHIRSVVNHPTHIAMTRRVPAAAGRTSTAPAAAGSPRRAAEDLVPA